MIDASSIVPFTLVLGAVVFVVLKYIVTRVQSVNASSIDNPTVGNNPTFRQFQNRYFLVLIPAMFADWLQGPYLYALYQGYGYMEQQISIIYVVGFFTNILTCPWSARLVARYERRRLALLALLLYGIASLMKVSRIYAVLLMSRIATGVATSVLFSAFDAWYANMHIEQIDFPREWISLTASKTAEYNAILAVLAGLTSNLITYWFKAFHEISPFLLSIPFLSISAMMILIYWSESGGTSKRGGDQNIPSIVTGLKEIFSSKILFLIGTLQALFESSMYVFIFVWTPILRQGSTSLGSIFASFMMFALCGSMTYKWLTIRYKTLPITLLALSVVMSLLANVFCVFFLSSGGTSPDPSTRMFLYLCFLIIEFSVGIYFPAISSIRSRVLSQEKFNASSIIYWFRVPVNMIACVVLISLHGSRVYYGNMCIFVSCSVFMAFACLAVAGIGSSMEQKDKEINCLEQQI